MSRLKTLSHRMERDKKQASHERGNGDQLPAVASMDMPGLEELLMEPVGERGKPIVSVHGRDVDEHELEQKEKKAA